VSARLYERFLLAHAWTSAMSASCWASGRWWNTPITLVGGDPRGRSCWGWPALPCSVCGCHFPRTSSLVQQPSSSPPLVLSHDQRFRKPASLRATFLASIGQRTFSQNHQFSICSRQRRGLASPQVQLQKNWLGTILNVGDRVAPRTQPSQGDSPLSKQVSVYGQEVGLGVNLEPGQQAGWSSWGPVADDHHAGWVVVRPQRPFEGEEKSLEISQLAYVVLADGSARINFTVKNTGSNVIPYYKIYHFWTDALPT
jgi:hypothetical protein